MKNKGANISKASFVFKCHVEKGQGRESTEKGNYNSKEGPRAMCPKMPLGSDLCQQDPHS